MIEPIGFGVIAASLILSALRVVTSRNLVHSVLWLGLTLFATAILYVWLSAPFLAGVQVLLYTGGVVTLMIFGVMLTRRTDPRNAVNEAGRRGWGAAAAVGLFGLLAAAIYRTEGLPVETAEPPEVADIGRAFLTEHVAAFEVLSLLLLAAMVGAIVIARRRDPERKPEGEDP